EDEDFWTHFLALLLSVISFLRTTLVWTTKQFLDGLPSYLFGLKHEFGIRNILRMSFQLFLFAEKISYIVISYKYSMFLMMKLILTYLFVIIMLPIQFPILFWVNQIILKITNYGKQKKTKINVTIFFILVIVKYRIVTNKDNLKLFVTTSFV
ncbi:hypothetical protein RFI_29385, partial [Reticulomyxa filosa]